MLDSFLTPWTIARQAPLSMGFPRQEYWSGLPFPSPGDLPDAGIGPVSPALADGFFTTEPPRKPPNQDTHAINCYPKTRNDQLIQVGRIQHTSSLR